MYLLILSHDYVLILFIVLTIVACMLLKAVLNLFIILLYTLMNEMNKKYLKYDLYAWFCDDKL